MALENIVQKLRFDRDQKIKEIKEAALSVARRSEEEGNQKGELLKKEILSEIRGEAEKNRERVIVNAQIQSRKEILSFKQQGIDKIFIKAFDDIRKSEKLYRQLIEKIIIKAVKKDEEIIICSRDKKIFSERWLKNLNKKNNLSLKISKETGRFSGGVIIRAGKKEFNASFKTLMKESQEKYEVEITRILFQE